MGDWELSYMMLYKQSDSLLLVLWTLMSFLILEHKPRCYTIWNLNIKRVYKENRRKEKPDDISCTKIHTVYVFLLTYISDTIELFPSNECCQITELSLATGFLNPWLANFALQICYKEFYEIEQYFVTCSLIFFITL